MLPLALSGSLVEGRSRVDAETDCFQRAANEDEGVMKAAPGSVAVLGEAEGVVEIG